MSAGEPLDLERVLNLVADASDLVRAGLSPDAAAAGIITDRNPTARELAAARHQNQEIHGGGTPEILRQFLPPSPVPEDILRLRRMIDDVLAAAQRQLPPGR